MLKKIQEIIIEEIKEVAEENIDSIGIDTVIFGTSGVVDSIGLVSLIVAVEQRIEDEFDTSIMLADEKAMSQKNSPFRTVTTLSEYISLLIGETND